MTTIVGEAVEEISECTRETLFCVVAACDGFSKSFPFRVKSKENIDPQSTVFKQALTERFTEVIQYHHKYKNVRVDARLPMKIVSEYFGGIPEIIDCVFVP